MAADDYPVPAFNFKVAFSATAGMSDTSFQEVSGMKASIDAESYTELGENGFVYQLPKPATYTNLNLKRGIASMTSPLVLWCRSIFETGGRVPIIPMEIMIYLMDENKLPARAWGLTGAYPISWEVGAFNSTKNEVAIETIELRYNYMTRLI